MKKTVFFWKKWKFYKNQQFWRNLLVYTIYFFEIMILDFLDRFCRYGMDTIGWYRIFSGSYRTFLMFLLLSATIKIGRTVLKIMCWYLLNTRLTIDTSENVSSLLWKHKVVMLIIYVFVNLGDFALYSTFRQS